MTACELCWARASFLAATRGGHTADHYAALLKEYDAAHPGLTEHHGEASSSQETP